MSHTAPLLALTEAIYDAAAGGTPWPAVASQVRRLTDAERVTLIVGDLDDGGPIEVLCGAGPAATADYLRHYRHTDLWTRRAAAVARRSTSARVVQVFANNEALVDDAEFLRSEFWNDFGRHHGFRYAAGTVVPLGEAGMMPVAVHRPAGARPFGREQRTAVAALLPHLTRAMQIRHRLRPAASAPGLDALDALPVGVVCVDRGLRVEFANAAAEAMAAAGDGGAAVRLLADGGAGPGDARRTLLAAAHRADGARLAALVADAAGGGPGGAVRLRGAEDGAPRLAAMAAPLPGRLAGSAARGALGRVPGRALVLLRSLAAPEPPRAALLRELFGLSRAEAEVARALTGGATKAEVAAARGLSEATVRTQARAVFEKTGAAGLRELERLMAGLAGV